MLGDGLRQIDVPVTCPAGVPIGERLEGGGCFCKITETPVLSALDPSSLRAFCAGDHKQCPVWRRDKEATWEAKGDNRATALDHVRNHPRQRVLA